VTLRPVDEATVRIFALQGIAGKWVESKNGKRSYLLAVPDVAHGSGVLLSADGLVLTAKHVIDGADRVTILRHGASEALPVTVLHAAGKHDIAFLRATTAGAPHLTLPPSPPPLTMLQPISISGFPLDPREELPAAAAGVLSRVNRDGELELSIAVNPGNSGGPVIDAQGRLLGIISKGADPTKGAQGFALAEPIGRILELHGKYVASAATPATAAGARDDELAQVVADLVRAGHFGLVWDAQLPDQLKAAVPESN
jgi:S1-C subfamily serine protease